MPTIYWTHKPTALLVDLVLAFGPDTEFRSQTAKAKGIHVSPIQMASLRTSKLIRRVRRDKEGFGVYSIPYDVHKKVQELIHKNR